ncbi:MAG: patatin-like phospholipase family protein [Deltaproteobacteria bacterium]|nr:patatin-like phospholipase family protein [Deltaproteobacteria bacterium]
MTIPSDTPSMAVERRPRIALILAGGGARGAYEAGVLAFLIEDLPKRLGFLPTFDIVSGASVGSIHAAYWMATLQEEVAARAARLASTWESMSLERVYRLSLGDLLRIPTRLVSFPFTTGAAGGRSSVPMPSRIPGLLDTSALEEMVRQQIPWRQLRGNLRARGGVLCVSCTEIASGRAVVFVDGARVSLKPWEYDPYVVARASGIGPAHILASAAIPLFFPAVRIGRHFYCDGGLRLNTPLSPALRLGADRLLLVALRHPPDPDPPGPIPSPREQAYGNPAYLVGKVLNAMLLDHVDYDLQRMRLMNALLLGGQQAFGPEFLPRINEIIRASRGTDYRVVRDCVIRPSEDLGRLAGRCYAERSRSLSPARLVADLVMRSAAHGVPEGEADLLSYVLFDAAYTRQLFALGRRDAASQGDEIAALFAA